MFGGRRERERGVVVVRLEPQGYPYSVYKIQHQPADYIYLASFLLFTLDGMHRRNWSIPTATYIFCSHINSIKQTLHIARTDELVQYKRPGMS